MHPSLGRKSLTYKRRALAIMSSEVAEWTWCSEQEIKKGNEIIIIFFFFAVQRNEEVKWFIDRPHPFQRDCLEVMLQFQALLKEISYQALIKSKPLGGKKKSKPFGGAWLAQPAEHMTLDLQVVSSSIMLGTELT